MKKIKLNSGKLKLKKESIGNLLSKNIMKKVMGGQQQTGVGGCTDFTKACPPNTAPATQLCGPSVNVCPTPSAWFGCTSPQYGCSF